MLELMDREWKEFVVDELFCMNTGASISQSKFTAGQLPRITAQNVNNGIGLFTNNIVDKNLRKIKNVVTYSFLGSSFYHSYLLSLDMKIHSLKRKDDEFNKYTGLFIARCLKHTIPTPSYGDQVSSKDLLKKKVLLPIDIEGKPDWKFMEQYTKERYQKLAKEYIEHISHKLMNLRKTSGGVDLLSNKNWREFELSNVFSINSTSSSIDKIKLNDNSGDIPYISRTAIDNGIKEFVSIQEKYNLDNGNCITIGLDTQTANYQPKDFYTSQNIQVLRNTNLNAMNAQFIMPLLRNLLTIFNWGSTGATLSRLRRSKIMLPINIEGNPDWEYMENYAMEKSQKAYSEYIDYIMPQIS